MNGKYRIVNVYDGKGDFKCYNLQIRVKFLWFKWWENYKEYFLRGSYVKRFDSINEVNQVIDRFERNSKTIKTFTDV